MSDWVLKLECLRQFLLTFYLWAVHERILDKLKSNVRLDRFEFKQKTICHNEMRCSSQVYVDKIESNRSLVLRRKLNMICSFRGAMGGTKFLDQHQPVKKVQNITFWIL